jgi:Holliday junction resolvase
MNSRAKGKRGELEWAKFLTGLGLPARRGAQFSGSPDSPDVVGGIPGTHPEVKRVENLNVYDAMEQAVADSGGKRVPYVAHRKNNKEWLVTIRASDLFEFGQRVYEALQSCKPKA